MQNHHPPGDLQAFLLGAAATTQSTINLHSYSALACIRVHLDKVHEQQHWPQHFLPQLPSLCCFRANSAGLVFRKISSFLERENNTPKANVLQAELRRLCSHLVIQS